MSDAESCVNCGRGVGPAGQRFCPDCGQATPPRRIDWDLLAHEFEHGVLHMDRGLLYSLRELMLRPGRLIGDYLAGRRTRQAKPLLLLMIMAAVVVFLGKYLLGGDVVGSTIALGDVAESGGDSAEAARTIVDGFAPVQAWMNRNYAFSTLLLLPLQAAAFRLAFHRHGGLNYPEWLVVSAFLTVQAFVLWIVAIPLLRWFPQAQVWSVWAAMAYGVFSLVQLFSGHPRWKSGLRTVLGFAIYGLATTVIVTLLVMAVLLGSSAG